MIPSTSAGRTWISGVISDGCGRSSKAWNSVIFAMAYRSVEESSRPCDCSQPEMAARLTWKPYMHDPTLEHFLPRVTNPALIVWGREDRIVPLECGELYRRARVRLRSVEARRHAAAAVQAEET